MNGLDGLPFDDLFTLLQDLMGINFSPLNCRKHFFSQRIINDWNKLPHDIIELPKTYGHLNENLVYFGKILVLIMHS